MINHGTISDTEVRALIRQGKIRYGGNKRLKIYGLLSCSHGKRMKRENRLFFHAATLAIEQGYRPCGHCCKQAYKHWKDGLIQ